MIEIVCAYCGKKMGEKDGEGVSGISHSICEKCFVIQMKEMKNEFRNANIR